MKKIVLYGDGLICPPHGYGEALADLLALRLPGLAFQAFQAGTESLDLETALKNAALHVIGKAPDLIFLALGHSDLAKQTAPEKMSALMTDLVKLLSAKTGAYIVIASACPAFLPEELRESAQAFNTLAQTLQGERCLFIDLTEPIGKFLERQRVVPGEKRALHQNALRLTSMGRTLLAHAALDDLSARGLLND